MIRGNIGDLQHEGAAVWCCVHENPSSQSCTVQSAVQSAMQGTFCLIAKIENSKNQIAPSLNHLARYRHASPTQLMRKLSIQSAALHNI